MRRATGVAAGIIFGGEITSFSYDVDGFLSRNVAPYDPNAHRWLALGFDGGRHALQWLISSDALAWEVVDEELDVPLEFDFEAAQLELGAGAWAGPYEATPLAAFGHAFVCES